MTVIIFLALLLFFATITSLITEAIKKMLPSYFESYNIVVCIVAFVVGFVGLLIYFILTHTQLTIDYLIYAFLMGLATWLSAMVGYDKVKQTIEQLLL